MSIHILARFTTAKGQLEKMHQHLKVLNEWANGDKEPGTLVYTITEDPKDDHKITIWEEYKDEEAFEFHKAQEPFVAFAAEIKTLLEGDLDLTVLRKADL